MPGRVTGSPSRARAISLPIRRLVWYAKVTLGCLFLVVITRYACGLGDTRRVEYQSAGRALESLSADGIAEERQLLADQGRFRGDGATARFLASSGNTTAAQQHSAVTQNLEGTLCFIIVCFAVACALDHWNMLLPDAWQFPISVLLFTVGMFIGIAFQFGLEDKDWQGHGFDTFIEGMLGASHIDPHAIFYLLLPPLLYESASSMSWRVLRKVLVSSMILALPGVLLNTALTACFVRLFFSNFNWEASLLLASILSATDPVAVVAALVQLGAPKKLATLIEGESLLNDGSAVVFFFVFLDMVAKKAPDSTKQCPGMPPSGGCVVLYFLKLAICGPALGLFVGWLVFLWIHWAQQHGEVLEIAIVIFAVYGLFFLAEFCLHVSGVLAVVAFGMLVTVSAHSRMSKNAKHAHHVIFAQVGYACNQVIFFAAGMISARFIWNNDSIGNHTPPYKKLGTWLELVALYACIHATRTIVVLVFAPVLTRLGYGITWKEAMILVWGGLRGAVGLALGLMVEHNSYVDSEIAAKIAFHVSGIVLLTLLINGTTIDTVYKKLQIYRPNPFRMNYVRKVLVTLERVCIDSTVARMKRDWFFSDVVFETILTCVPRFTHVGFDARGVPYADDLVSTYESLGNLVAPRKRVLAGTFQDAWHEAKHSSQSELWTLLRQTVNIPVDQADHMRNVSNTGDERISYPAQSETAAGFYVSARPLSALRREWDKSEADSFSVKILSAESIAVVVGLAASSEPTLLEESAEYKETQVLGFTPHSIGLNCGNGKITYKADAERQELKTKLHHVTGTETVTFEVTKEVEEEWKVSVLIDRGLRGSTRTLLAQCSLGTVAPTGLYPVVQFIPIRQSNGGFASQNFYPKRDSKFHHASSSGKNSQNAFPLPSLSRAASVLAPVNVANNREETGAACARVCMSYELQNATVNETLSQIFHAVFNFLSQQYHDMYEQGIIGDGSLTQLLEAAGEALDCADHELHHKHALDYEIHDNLGEVPPSLGFSSKGLRQLSMDRKDKKKKLHRTHFVQARKLGITSKSYLIMFEPAIVQYMALEHHCSVDNLFDCFPVSWQSVRKYGYGNLLSKVEILWAFVSAHMKMLRECAALKQQPQLVECFEGIVMSAQRDLKILQDLRPRRFFYSKYFLALRVMMTIRLEKLKHFIDEGWISAEAGENLTEELWDRIHSVRRFVPPYKSGVRDSTEPPNGKDQVSPVGVLPTTSTTSIPTQRSSASLSMSEARSSIRSFLQAMRTRSFDSRVSKANSDGSPKATHAHALSQWQHGGHGAAGRVSPIIASGQRAHHDSRSASGSLATPKSRASDEDYDLDSQTISPPIPPGVTKAWSGPSGREEASYPMDEDGDWSPVTAVESFSSSKLKCPKPADLDISEDV